MSATQLFFYHKKDTEQGRDDALSLASYWLFSQI